MRHFAGEKRKFERSELGVPAAIELDDRDTTLYLCTRDISAGGAFFYTEPLIEEGMKVKIEIVSVSDVLEQLIGYLCYIPICGTVVRCEFEGIAVSFGCQK